MLKRECWFFFYELSTAKKITFERLKKTAARGCVGSCVYLGELCSEWFIITFKHKNYYNNGCAPV